MPRIPALMQRMLDWIVVLVGIFIGIGCLTLLAFGADRGADLLLELSLLPIVLFPWFASMVAIRNRKRASFLLLVAAPATGACLIAAMGLRAWLSHDAAASDVLVALLLVIVVPCTLGLFWFATHRLNWPPIIEPRPASLKRKIVRIFVGSLALAIAIWVGTFTLAVRNYLIGDCSGYDPPIVRQQSPDHVAFRGKVIYVGNSVDRSGHKYGEWALVRVEQRFWGLSNWNHRFVVVTQNIFESGQEYFISGHRREGLLTHFLIVEVGPCRGPLPLRDAEVELRVLRDGAPKNGVRIIGFVRDDHMPDYRNQIAPGVNVVITGPTGSVTTATDQHGIYDVTGLPPGRYSIRMEAYNEKSQRYPSCGLGSENPKLEVGDVWGCTIGF